MRASRQPEEKKDVALGCTNSLMVEIHEAVLYPKRFIAKPSSGVQLDPVPELESDLAPNCRCVEPARALAFWSPRYFARRTTCDSLESQNLELCSWLLLRRVVGLPRA